MHQHTAKYAVSHCQICCIWGSVCIIGSVWSAFGAVGFGTSKHQIFMKRPYLYSKGTFWGSTSRPHIGHLVRTLFLLWGPPIMTGDGPKITYFGPKLAKHVKLVIVPKWSKRVQKGPKWSTQVFFTIWDPFGRSGPIWNISDKNDFFAPNGPKGSRWAQNGSKMIKNI